MKAINKRRGGIIIIATVVLSLLYIIGVTQTKRLPVNSKNESASLKVEAGDHLLDPWSEINMIADKYINNKQLSLSGNMKLYDETSKLLEEQNFSYTKSSDNMFYSLGSMEMASDKEYSVAVDNVQKIIAVTRLQDNTMPGKVFDIDQLKKLMNEHKATAKVLQNNDQRVIVVENIDFEDIANYKLYYSPVTYQVTKIVLEMSTALDLSDKDPAEVLSDITNDKPESDKEETGIDTLSIDQSLLSVMNNYIVEINYTNGKIQQVNTDPVKKFVTIRNKNIYITENYKDYELINQLSKN